MPLALLGVDNILFAVGDLERALAFYRDQLGLPITFAVPEVGVVGLRLGGDQTGLILRSQDGLPEAGPRPTPRVWLVVADARAADAALRAAGLTPLAPPFAVRTGWTVEIADPWGNVLGLTDYTSAPQISPLTSNQTVQAANTASGR
ncbi:MAG: VOC family protein [Chloroflexi bacterium]|nr:VOC family protein [Chloroflexota bacterium]